MSPAETDLVNTLLADWFGDLNSEGLPPPERVAQWWKKDAAFDDYLRGRYGAWVARAIDEQLGHFSEEPRAWLALLLLLDQLPRNIYRDAPQMYAGDNDAVRISLEGLEVQRQLSLPVMQQVFALMPLMHSEQLEHQQRSLSEFITLHEHCGPSLKPTLAGNVKFAQAHLDIVARFGRFPHRNELLGRSSTAEELAFLKTPGSSF